MSSYSSSSYLASVTVNNVSFDYNSLSFDYTITFSSETTQNDWIYAGSSLGVVINEVGSQLQIDNRQYNNIESTGSFLANNLMLDNTRLYQFSVYIPYASEFYSESEFYFANGQEIPIGSITTPPSLITTSLTATMGDDSVFVGEQVTLTVNLTSQDSSISSNNEPISISLNGGADIEDTVNTTNNQAIFTISKNVSGLYTYTISYSPSTNASSYNSSSTTASITFNDNFITSVSLYPYILDTDGVTKINLTPSNSVSVNVGTTVFLDVGVADSNQWTVSVGDVDICGNDITGDYGTVSLNPAVNSSLANYQFSSSNTAGTYNFLVEYLGTIGYNASSTNFSITYNAVNSGPTITTISPISVSEGTNSVAFTATGEGDLSWSLVSGDGDGDNTSFTMGSTAGILTLNSGSFDYESGKTSYAVRVKVSDGTTDVVGQFVIEVPDINEYTTISIEFPDRTTTTATLNSPAIDVSSVSVPLDSSLNLVITVKDQNGNLVNSGYVNLIGMFAFLSIVDENNITNTLIDKQDFELTNGVLQINIPSIPYASISIPNNTTFSIYYFDNNNLYNPSNKHFVMTTPPSQSVNYSFTNFIVGQKTVSFDYVINSQMNIASFSVNGDFDLIEETQIDFYPNTKDVSGSLTYEALENFNPEINYSLSFTYVGEVYDFYTKNVLSTGNYQNGFPDTTIYQFTGNETTPNSAPTITTSSTISVSEGTNSVAFTATDTDGNNLTWSLVSGDGDTDNTSFTMGSTAGILTLNSGSFDYESGKTSYAVRVKVNDGTTDVVGQFVINVNNDNEAPTNITLSNSSIDENNAVNAVIGTFSTTDTDVGDTFIYSLVGGTGDTDNSSFNILGSSLRAGVVFDYETKNSYSIRVRSTDTSSNSFEKSFTITINSTVVNPIVTWVSPPSPIGSGTFNATIQTYTTNFGICFKTGNTLTPSDTIKYINLALATTSSVFGEPPGSLNVELRNTTNDTPLSAVAGTTVYASDVISFTLPSTTNTNFDVNLNEAQIPNIANYTLQANTAYALILYKANRVFAIRRTTGYTSSTVNSAYTVTNGFNVLNTLRNNTTYIPSTSNYSTLSISFGTIEATPSNSAPSDISLNNLTIAENAGDNAVVGTLSTTDADAGDTTFTYTLVGGTGDTDNSSFNILNDQLRVNNSLDFESKSSYSVRIRSTDQGGLSTEKEFTITVIDVNDFTLTDLSGNVFSLPYATQSYNLNDSLDLTGANLRGADLTGAIMNGVNLTNAILGGVELSNGQASIPQANLTNASLIGAIIGGLDLVLGNDVQGISVILTGANLRNADFTGLDPYNSNEGNVFDSFFAFTTVLSMEGANFSNCNLLNIPLYNVDLSGANFTNTIFDGADFTNSNLTNADFTNATLNGVIFSNATITNTDFTGSSLAIGSGPFSSYQGVILPEGLAIDPSGYVVVSNSAPSDITLSQSSIAENNAVNAVIGTLSTTDSVDDTFTYTLVGGTGDTDNSSFNILNDQLRVNNSLDFESKSSYSVRIRSTDQGGLSTEKAFTITVSDVNEAPVPGSTASPFGITGGQISQEILSLTSGSSFFFLDSYSPSLPAIETTLFKGVTGALGDVSQPGPQVSIVDLGITDRNIVYAPISDELHSSLNLDGNYSMIFKVFDNSGNIIPVLEPPMSMDIFLDSSKSTIILTANGQPAGVGLRQSQSGNKYRYRVDLLRGDGETTILAQDSNPSAGSDPHITTLFGKKYDFHPSTRKNYTLLKTKEVNITSHFTGLKNGVFYDRVNIELANKEKLEVDFNKQKIRGKSKFIEVQEKSNPIAVKYNNQTNNKSVGKSFTPKNLTKLSYKGKTPMDLYIDYQTRYVHFRFPDVFPDVDEMSGLIVEPATRLD